MSSYCDLAPGHPFHGPYHDLEYGFPLTDQNGLFERFCLEIFQAGLSWLIILKRREGMRLAFDGFDPVKIASYGQADIERLLGDARIIRNRRKIEAVIENAKRINEIGCFAEWIEMHYPSSKEEWVKLFRKAFTFAGPEVVGEFLMSIGKLPGAHREDCPVYGKILG